MDFIVAVPITAEAAVTRNSIATYWDRKGALQVAPANTLRVTYDRDDLNAAPYPLIEQAATKCLPANDALNTWSSYNNGAGSVSVQSMTDPQFGTFFRITKTAGAVGAAVGIVNPPAGITGHRIVVSAYVRRGLIRQGNLTLQANAVDSTGVVRQTQVQLGAGGAGGWGRISAVSAELAANVTLTSSGNMFIHLSGEVGDYVDIKLPEIELGTVATSPVAVPAGGAPFTRAADTLPTTSGMLYSSLTENDTDDAPPWVTAQAVPKDALRRSIDHKVYKALQAVDTGQVTKRPEENPLDANGNPYWQEWAPTKRWAAFDTTLDTSSTATDSITWVIKPDKIVTALAALNMDSADVRVSLTLPDGRVMYRRTKNLVLKTSRKITDFFFKSIERRTDEVFADIPPFIKGLICVTVTKPNSTVSIADIKMGRLEEIGETLTEPEVRTLRRHTVKDNGFGKPKFTKRPVSKLMSAQVFIEGVRADAVKTLIDRYTSDFVVIIGDERFTSLIILGFVEDFQLSFPDADGAYYTIKAQGLGQ